MVEGSPRCHWAHTRRGRDRPRRLLIGPGRAGPGRKAGTDNRVGHAIRVDLAGAAMAARVRPGDHRHRAHLLLWTGCGSGLGLDLARRGGGHHPLAVGVAALQVVYRQLHGLRSFVRHGRRGHSSFSGSTYPVSPSSRARNSTPKSNTRLRTGKRQGKRTRTDSCSSGGGRRAHFDNVNDLSSRRLWGLHRPGLQAHIRRRGRNQPQHRWALLTRCPRQNRRRRARQISSPSL